MWNCITVEVKRGEREKDTERNRDIHSRDTFKENKSTGNAFISKEFKLKLKQKVAHFSI